jgi:CheY-like chemotaxis protein
MKKLLIVEDDKFLERMASKKLRENGYEVLPAYDGNQALDILNSQTPDMILLDLLLPGTDGFELLAKIRQNNKTKDVPIMVFSNLSGEGDIKKCKDLGIRDFVVKSSCTLNELVDKVNKTMEGNGGK